MKIYTDFGLVKKPGRIAYPLLPFFHTPPLIAQKYPVYMETATSIFTMTSLDKCDVAMYPLWWNGSKNSKMMSFINECGKRGKKTIVLSMSDYPRHQ